MNVDLMLSSCYPAAVQATLWKVRRSTADVSNAHCGSEDCRESWWRWIALPRLRVFRQQPQENYEQQCPGEYRGAKNHHGLLRRSLNPYVNSTDDAEFQPKRPPADVDQTHAPLVPDGRKAGGCRRSQCDDGFQAKQSLGSENPVLDRNDGKSGRKWT
jgi:hypothetical protein